jgi:iodotyrosine deiodinase
VRERWLQALAPLGTDHHEPFPEEAPYLIAFFAQQYITSPDGERVDRYYVQESAGIAIGFLIAALHYLGLARLAEGASRMGFLRDLVGRPERDRAFCRPLVAYPAAGERRPSSGRRRSARSPSSPC